MTDDDHRHGTYAGYKLHIRSKVPICEPCREASREKAAVYRAANPATSSRCVSCTKRTTSKTRICRACSTTHRAAEEEVSDDYALTDGRWVRRPGGVYLWVADWSVAA